MVPGLSDAVSAATAAVVAAHAQAQSQAQAQAEAQMQEAEEEEEEEQVELGGERKEDVSRTSKAHRRRCWLGPGYRFHHRTTNPLLGFPAGFTTGIWDAYTDRTRTQMRAANQVQLLSFAWQR